MRRKIQWISVMVLTVCLSFSLLGASAFASTQSEATPTVNEKWNIMLVVDGSGSLFSDQKTDPEGLRFSAIDSFLNILSILDAQSGSSGNDVVCNAGGIVFSATDKNSTTDESMLRGIRMSTGLIPFDGNSGTDTYIAEKIRSAPLDYHSGGTTDIGTALLVASSDLVAAASSDVKSAIFLFTDGNTDMNTTATFDKSMENLAAAEQIMRDNGIELCGVFLNKDGMSQSQEVMDIVIAANDLGGNGAALASHYAEITNSASIQPAMDIFLKCIGLAVQTPIEVHFPIHQEMRIPGGVKSVTIRLYSADGSGMPFDMTAKLTMPDGSIISGAALDAITTDGNSFRNYMILNPAPGTWSFDADSDWSKTNNTKVYFYSPVVDCYSKAGLEISPDVSQLHANSTMTVRAFLLDQGIEVTDPTAYKEYNCKLVFVDTKTLTAKTKDLLLNSNNRFEQTINLDFYGTYDVSAVFECDSVQIETQTPITLILENHAPECRDINLRVPYGLFQSRIKSYDVLKKSNDIEDGKNLSLSVLSGSCNTSAVRVNGSELMIEGKAVGNGELRILATDSQGAGTEFTVKINDQNMTLTIIFIALGAILVIAVVVIIAMRNKVRPKGKLKIKLRYNGISIMAELPCPEKEYSEKKVPLYSLIESDLNRQANSKIKQAVETAGISYAEIKKVFEKDEQKLSKVIVSATTKKTKMLTTPGKSKTIKKGAVAVRYGKREAVLFNSDTSSILQDINSNADYRLYYEAEKDRVNPWDNNNYFSGVPQKPNERKKTHKKDSSFYNRDF